MNTGGKLKPLKAPKKQSKDVDEDDLAFKVKYNAVLALNIELARVGYKFCFC